MVLMGVFDAELSEYLVERGSKGALKFAFPSRGERIEEKMPKALNTVQLVIHSGTS